MQQYDEYRIKELSPSKHGLPGNYVEIAPQDMGGVLQVDICRIVKGVTDKCVNLTITQGKNEVVISFEDSKGLRHEIVGVI